ncbi:MULTISPECIES: ABC transporter ATP-binding protein [Pseudonocardia]|uniref:Cobalamin/Fe3+-siderophore ABC transporter ATP-binding protein n=2 Tax=Pseudonocardia TaxID=1847 RepID=A0ABQ0RSL0_9PSEU|nr:MULTISPECIES: ABC transporter ATP-binding protein [Pseudonocardia]OSY44053.1 putative siderophore transport system ATP-binding protein YusV [Pseudonocardia autotrophica]TDN74217.1 iron complex transport system ATP-binding protein [Pseudonocardia autotrophica]BBG04977.1 cobalamin/Fe3+-siderophore ABC transporter ATP-binding protein [Pseudonocardia autotrophica]GEC23633.1 cobalamin/Fe3+-siderophore ABC transporter ATP-binding protein [Pseudonocardia saturnea]
MTLTGHDLSLGYTAGQPVVDGQSVQIPDGRITVIVGPNACGKSTLLRGLAGLMRPQAGRVLLDDTELSRLPATELARRLGVLPQQPTAPDGITVADLVGRGRHPHQRWFRQWSEDDEQAVTAALAATGLTDLADRPVAELSGGQRQRAWIALVLAQGPETMLLDEPTTFLDLAHQLDVLELMRTVNVEQGRTVVMVLHDLELAARYAHHLIAMAGGRIVAEGAPGEVVTEELVSSVFGVDALVTADPLTGTPLVLPRPRR